MPSGGYKSGLQCSLVVSIDASCDPKLLLQPLFPSKCLMGRSYIHSVVEDQRRTLWTWQFIEGGFHETTPPPCRRARPMLHHHRGVTVRRRTGTWITSRSQRFPSPKLHLVPPLPKGRERERENCTLIHTELNTNRHAFIKIQYIHTDTKAVTFTHLTFIWFGTTI